MVKVYHIQRESGRVLGTIEFNNEQNAAEYIEENNRQPGADLYIRRQEER